MFISVLHKQNVQRAQMYVILFETNCIRIKIMSYRKFELRIMNYISYGDAKIIVLSRVSVCAADEFQCDGTRCIRKSQRCDRVDDCLDRTDEQNCPRTTGKSIF